MSDEKIKAQPFDCMQYFYGAVQEPLIRCLIRFRGHMDTHVLKRAVNLSIAAFPLIGCCFDEKQHCWVKRRFTADSILHPVDTYDSDGAMLTKRLLSSIDPVREPQLKLFLVRAEADDTLCVIINHMACDGGGFKEYLYLLARLFSECEKDARFADAPNPSGRRNLNQLLQNLSFRRELGILFSKTRLSKPDPSMRIPLEGDPSTPFIVIRRIDEKLFASIRSFAKSNHASVNDMLLTGYIRALHQIIGCNDITVPCPVDLRKYRNGNQTCGFCNLTSNYICHVDMAPGGSFDETLYQVSAQMRTQKESDVCLKGPMLYHMMFHILPFGAVRKLFYKLSPVPVTSYTNLGILDSVQLHFGSLTIDDAFISTAVKNTPYFQLSISTFRGRCTMTSSLHGTEEDGKTVNKLFEYIIKEFENLF